MPIQAIPTSEEAKINLETTYLESKGELDDYILDTGDILNIKFINFPEMSISAAIDEQGEIYLDRINETFVRGLTIAELEDLLEESYQKFLIDPEIKIRSQRFKPLRISIGGEVRNPGIIRFRGFNSSSFDLPRKLKQFDNKNQQNNLNNTESSSSINYQFLNNNNNNNNNLLNSSGNFSNSSGNFSNNVVKRTSDFVSTISNAINKAGGLTSYSDIKRIELIREIPIGKGVARKSNN